MTPDLPAEQRASAQARGRARSGQIDKRSMVIAAAVLVVVLVGGIAVVTLFSDSGPRQDTQGQLSEQGGAKPHIIERPNSGVAPKAAGDRGGWEQLALFGVLAVAIVGIGVAVFRSGGRARDGRRAWQAAAATGRDGAVEEVAPPPRT